MNILHEIGRRSLSDACGMFCSFVWTRIFFPKALLIRRPFYKRGKRSSIIVSEGTITGRNCRFETYKNGRISIGKRCHIGDYVRITCSNSVKIGDDCFFASKVLITDSSHGNYSNEPFTSPLIPPNDRPLIYSSTEIGKNVWLGENVVVLPGVTIGDGCVVGANAVVSKDLPPNTIAGGIPAKSLKQWNFETNQWERV